MNLALKNLELAGEIQGPPHCLNSQFHLRTSKWTGLLKRNTTKETKGVRGQKTLIPNPLAPSYNMEPVGGRRRYVPSACQMGVAVDGVEATGLCSASLGWRADRVIRRNSQKAIFQMKNFPTHHFANASKARS